MVFHSIHIMHDRSKLQVRIMAEHDLLCYDGFIMSIRVGAKRCNIGVVIKC